MTATAAFRFDNSYARDLQGFAVPWRPAAAPAPKSLFFNAPLAEELGLDAAALAGDAGAALFAGNAVPEGAEPIAQAYAGHQFGGFSPQLGDGRAVLLGEVIDRAGQRRDIALKGSGRTPFSRGGDGKAAVGPMLREVLIGEAMHALGIPTTRALAVVATGEPVFRETVLPGAVLTRVAASHIRVGTFQFFAARGDVDARAPARRVHDRPPRPRPGRHARPLPRAARARRRAPGGADRAMDERRLHPRRDEHRQHDDLGRDDRLRPVRLHRGLRPGGGVQLDRHAAAATPSATSPRIARWNLARLAETLLPLIGRRARGRRRPQATEVIEAFPARYRSHLLARPARQARPARRPAPTTRRRGARRTTGSRCCTRSRVDFTLAWRRLADAADGDEAPLRALLPDAAAPRRAGWRAGASAARATTTALGRRALRARPKRAPRACAASIRG